MPQNFAQLYFQTREFQHTNMRILLEFHQHINIAVRAKIITQYRPEQG